MPADAVRGFQEPNTSGTNYNTQLFLIQMALARISTATLVQVKAVTNDGGLSPVGFVDVLPLVNQIDGNDRPTKHQTVYHSPYFRLQGGKNAIILDPEVGDIGLMVFCDRDISSVVANKAQANPGSRRRFDMADGLYLGGFINDTPEQYVQFNKDGITISSPRALTVKAETTIKGSLKVTGNVSVGTGATGTFTTPAGQVVTVTDGIITNIY